MGERLTIVLDDGMSELLLKLAGSSRKQGEYLSGLIRAAYEGSKSIGGDDLDREALRLQVMGLTGQVKMLEGRLLIVERELAAMIAGSLNVHEDKLSHHEKQAQR